MSGIAEGRWDRPKESGHWGKAFRAWLLAGSLDVFLCRCKPVKGESPARGPSAVSDGRDMRINRVAFAANGNRAWSWSYSRR